MNPLAAAFLAAQGWDGNQGFSEQKQVHDLYDQSGNKVQVNPLSCFL